MWKYFFYLNKCLLQDIQRNHNFFLFGAKALSKEMDRECANHCTIFGCCLGMIFFAVAGGLRLAMKVTFGACLVNSPGYCSRQCDDRLLHCNFYPVYSNTSFTLGDLSKTCEWQTAHRFASNLTCQASLKEIGFGGECVHSGSLCVDPNYAPTSVAIASFFLTISGCCMLFFVWGCYATFHARKPEQRHGLLLEMHLQDN